VDSHKEKTRGSASTLRPMLALLVATVDKSADFNMHPRNSILSLFSARPDPAGLSPGPPSRPRRCPASA